MTAILGGIATLVASYIARVRGSNEPEKSLMRAKDLDQFIREAELFNMDYGHLGSTPEEKEKYDESLTGFRIRLEEILGHGEG
ncbi:hypothetical protein CPB83DRAFT_762661 [Crepidotus variabilis]|uniref:SMODS and SLOG-associating 2TM effector domain-containing protein n=1 Tax=Crepidotus variabilis TaxID=179855 RepID=A0A9P6EKD6_9AGAR|nr:hypothetical protein CPB83DRAFT_762661 [Crepidotus variabilis]